MNPHPFTQILSCNYGRLLRFSKLALRKLLLVAIAWSRIFSSLNSWKLLNNVHRTRFLSRHDRLDWLRKSKETINIICALKFLKETNCCIRLRLVVIWVRVLTRAHIVILVFICLWRFFWIFLIILDYLVHLIRDLHFGRITVIILHLGCFMIRTLVNAWTHLNFALSSLRRQIHSLIHFVLLVVRWILNFRFRIYRLLLCFC